MVYTVFAYEVTELTRTIEADSVEEAIAKAYRGSDTDWMQWSEDSLGPTVLNWCARNLERPYTTLAPEPGCLKRNSTMDGYDWEDRGAEQSGADTK